jgi:hypothetical protein
MNLNEIFETSKAVVDFSTNDKNLLENSSFVMAWGIARKKAMQTIELINTLFLIKKKYNISDFEIQLFLENFDETDLYGNK